MRPAGQARLSFSTRSGWRRALAAAAAVLCAALLLSTGWHWQTARAADARRQRGAALFHGELPLTGRLYGHAEALPSTATRCSNCHEALAGAPGRNDFPQLAAAGARTYGSAIRGVALSTPRARHGGPLTVYDEARLCGLLRTGIDSGEVMIASAMPRYEATADDCGALWAYLRHEPA